MGPHLRPLVAALAVSGGLGVGAVATVAADPLPFSDAELARALAVRVESRHQVRVAATGGLITIVVDGRTAALTLGGERGADAARLVALVAADLALEGAAGAALDLGAPAAVARAEARGATRRWTVAARAVVPPGTAESLGVLAAIESGGLVRRTFALGAQQADVAVPGSTVRVIGVPLRLGVAVGDRTSFAVAAVVEPLFASGGAGATSGLAGAGVSARTVVDTGASFALSIAAGVDVMANEIQYRWDGETVLTTGRFRPWLAIGATWEDR